jgi:hypothetical protein
MSDDAAAAGAAVAENANDRGMSISIPTTADAPAAVDKPDFSSLVPDEFKNEGWVGELAKNADPFGAFFKSHANALQVVGKKSVGLEVPGEGAPPEQVKAFYKALGVPDSPDGYEYKAPDVSKESETVQKILAERSKNDNFFKTMRQVFHEQGVPPKAAAAIAAKFDEIDIAETRSMAEGMAALQEKQNADARKAFTDYYGDKADAVEKLAKETALRVIPKEVAAMGAEAALIHALKLLHEKVYANDTVSGAGQGAPAEGLADLDRQINELRTRKDASGKVIYDNALAQGRDELLLKLRELYNRKGEMQRAAK